MHFIKNITTWEGILVVTCLLLSGCNTSNIHRAIKGSIQPDPTPITLIDGYPTKTIAQGQLISGYSVAPGETINWHLNAESVGKTNIAVTDVNGETVDSFIATVGPQTVQGSEPWRTGFGFDISHKYTVPATLKSGIYFLNRQQTIFFVVTSNTPKMITVVVPTNTLNAYSCTGGRSFYSCEGTQDLANRVSFLRPIRIPAGWRKFDKDALGISMPLVKWLESNEQYKDQVAYITDRELDILANYSESKLLLILGHNEYWSHRGKSNFEYYTQKLGKNSFLVSGNVMWWATRFEDEGNTMVVYKKMPDPEFSDSKMASGLFTTLDNSSIKAIGSSFTYGGYDRNTLEGTEEPNAMRIVAPDSPVFADTNLSLCDALDLSPNVEFDGMPISGFDTDGFPVIDEYKLDAYRAEILGYTWGNRFGHTIGTMHMFQKHESAGTVIQFGSFGAGGVAFTNNPGIYNQIINNIFSILTTNRSAFSENPRNPTALATGFKLPESENDLINLYQRCKR